jgi:hypothetical protein
LVGVMGVRRKMELESRTSLKDLCAGILVLEPSFKPPLGGGRAMALR